jgi:hypothetical protein
MDSYQYDLSEDFLLDITVQDAEEKKRIIKQTSIWNKIKITIFGQTVIGKYPNNQADRQLNLYLFKCPIHSYQISYPKGWRKTLECPICLKELVQNA